jgi:hypothetical protein
MGDKCAPYKHCKYTPFANCTAPAPDGPMFGTSSDKIGNGNGNGPPPPRNQCQETCADNSTMTHYKAASAYAVTAPGTINR